MLNDARSRSTFANEVLGKTPATKSDPEEMRPVSNLGARLSHGCMQRLITLLNAAVGQLHDQEHPAHDTVLEAASLLNKQIDRRAAREVPHGRGCLLAWQARKVRAYIDSHIEASVLIADLCALISLSEAHFSRAFRRTFGTPPHAFVMRRRVELAAQYMLQTEAPLSDIALRCGFTDQPHLSRLFRQTTGQTPAAWRRMHSARDDETGTPPTRLTQSTALDPALPGEYSHRFNPGSFAS